MKKNSIFLIFIFFCVLNINSQKISDFFKNEHGEIKISKRNQKKLYNNIGLKLPCALDNCGHDIECNLNEIQVALNSRIDFLYDSFNKKEDNISVLIYRNQEPLYDMQILIDTSNFLTDIQLIEKQINQINTQTYIKNKTFHYYDASLYVKSDLFKYISNLDFLIQKLEQISQLEIKMSEWFSILEPLESQRKVSVKREWFEFVDIQIGQKWKLQQDEKELIKQSEKLRHEENERQERLFKEEEKKKEKGKNEKIEEEKRKYTNWKKNTRFSIPYRVEIVKYISKCSYCRHEYVYKELNFPNLNFSNYGNEKYIKKLWDEHKQIIEKEIIGYRGFFNQSVFRDVTIILEDRKCKNCGHQLIEDKISTFQNKFFKN
jgi:ribosomal protein L32